MSVKDIMFHWIFQACCCANNTHVNRITQPTANLQTLFCKSFSHLTDTVKLFSLLIRLEKTKITFGDFPRLNMLYTFVIQTSRTKLHDVIVSRHHNLKTAQP